MKTKVDSISSKFNSSLTHHISVATAARQDRSATAFKASAHLITPNPDQITQNPPSFGFAFEHLQAIGFNLNEGLKSSEDRYSDQINNGMIKLSSNIYTEKIGEIITEIQAQAGSEQELEKHAPSDQISQSNLMIDIEGMKSFSVHQDFAQWVAENPYLAANVISVAALSGEAKDLGLEDTAINIIINLLFPCIKTIAAYCRGEQELKQTELFKIIEVTIIGLKTGFLRGVAIKVIQKLMDGSAFAALGFTVGIEVIPTLIKVLKDEITLEQAIKEVEPRMFTSAVMTTVVILFPRLGTELLSASVIRGIWEEISPEWRTYIIKMETQIDRAIAVGYSM